MNNLQQEIKNLEEKIKKKKPPSIKKTTELFARVLDQSASNMAFQIFNDKKFRLLSDFYSLPKIEQDRIFNELVVSYLVLTMLLLEAPDLQIGTDIKEYFQLLKNELPKAHLKELKELGIEKKYLKDWEKLIEMRYQEYHKDKLEVRSAAMEVEMNYKDLCADDLLNIQLLVPLQTVAVGCHTHICRGKTEGKDELFKYILKQMGRFYVELRLSLLGIKIPWWKKILIKLKIFVWDKLRKESV